MEKCYAIMNGISRIIPLNIRKIPTPFDPIQTLARQTISYVVFTQKSDDFYSRRFLLYSVI